MEQHPIPQNITGFEFKLIGDMTIKQFAYLVACVILAYVTYVLPFYAVIKYPLIFIFILLGIGLAFIPIEGRPLDKWLMNFIRALFAPNQYIFHKQGSTPDFFQVRNATLTQTKPTNVQSPNSQEPTRLEQYLQGLPNVQHNIPGITPPPAMKPMVPSHPSPTPLPHTPVQQPVVKPPVEMPMHKPEEEVKPHTVEMTQMQATAPVSVPQPEPVQTKPDHVSILYEENKKLREELEKIKLHVFSKAAPTHTPAPTPVPQPMEQPAPIVQTPPPAPVKPMVVTPPPAPVAPTVKPASSAFPKVPNLISGFVTDAKGDGLPNIIVEVKDPQGLPVRAFKTNPMGQFTAATPVANGTYTIELEDPKKTYSFPMTQMQANGSPLQPITVTAKDLSVSEREKIHSALFGGTS